MKTRRNYHYLLATLLLLAFPIVLNGCGSSNDTGSKELESYKTQVESLQEKNKTLEDENEKLKQENSSYQKKTNQITELKTENKSLKDQLEEFQANVEKLTNDIETYKAAQDSSNSIIDIMFWTDGKEYQLTNDDPDMYVYKDSSCLEKMGKPQEFTLESKISKTIDPENGFTAYAFRLKGGIIAFSSQEPSIEEKK